MRECCSELSKETDMGRFTDILALVKNTNGADEKNRLMYMIVSVLQDRKIKKTEEDKSEIYQFAVQELTRATDILKSTQIFKEKYPYKQYISGMLAAIALCCGSMDNIPAHIRKQGDEAVGLLQKEFFLETVVGKALEDSDTLDGAEAEKLLCYVVPLREEFHKGIFLQVLCKNTNTLSKIPEDGKKVIARYLKSEMRRYLDAEERDEDTANNLEFICDICKSFFDNDFRVLLEETARKCGDDIKFHACETLLKSGCDVPDGVIGSLAHNVCYAVKIHSALKRSGKENLFPNELNNEEYLAKSDMIQWLMYPTELGREPDEIEYLGKVKKKGIYHIFRFRSSSDTLTDDIKGKWLIGWSNWEDGGTFSQFSEYADFEKKTLDKTLKNIKRKCL